MSKYDMHPSETKAIKCRPDGQSSTYVRNVGGPAGAKQVCLTRKRSLKLAITLYGKGQLTHVRSLTQRLFIKSIKC